MGKNIKSTLERLWENGFFQSKKSFGEVLIKFNRLGYNPDKPALHNALRLAKYLTRTRIEGKYKYAQAAPKFSESEKEEKRGNIRELEEREMHPNILEVSSSLYYNGHFSQAIFEAFKEVNNMVKEKSGLRELDGVKLMTRCFNIENPKLKLSSLETTSEKDEQEGFMHIFMGSILGVRNPKGHERIKDVDRLRALEYLTLASLLARRVEDTLKSDK